MNTRFLVGGLVIVAAVGWLMYVGIRETSAYYLTIAEFLPQKESLAGEPIRVAGRVAPGSIAYEPRTLKLDFAIGAFEKDVAGGTVPVSFVGVKPDMFADGRDVIVEGRYSEGTLRAEKVLTSCPSKYEAKPGEEAKGGGAEPAESLPTG